MSKEKSDLVRGGRIVRIKIVEVLPLIVTEAFKDLAFPPPAPNARSRPSPDSLGLMRSLGLQGLTAREVKNIGLFPPPSIPASDVKHQS